MDKITTIKGIGALSYSIATLGPALAMGMIFASGINAMGRQPESAPLIRGTMFIGFALTEALALLGFVAPFVLK